MFSWSTRRRILYTTVVIGTIATLFGSYLFVTFYEPPSCFDGRHNQNEAGIDCGGACQFLCQSQVTDPIVLFSRSLEVSPGVYHVVSYVENPNFNAAVEAFDYTFRLFNEANQLITERSGSSFLTPGSISPIFEANVTTGNQIPARTFLEFDTKLQWTRVQGGVENPIEVKNQQLRNADTLPRIDAQLENTSVFDIKNVEVVAVIFNALGNAIAVSRTVIDELPRRSQQPIVFTWPTPLQKELEVCTAPVDVALAFDLSGSMNDDGGDPPQPLTDAKTAARDFIGRLGIADRASLITFATQSRVDQMMTSEHQATQHALDALFIDPAQETGSTNIGDAIFDATRELRSAAPIEQLDTSIISKPDQVIVLLTDGRANAPKDPGGEVYALQAAQAAKANNVVLYTIGLGSGVNSEFLRTISETPQHAYFAATSNDLDVIYGQISDAICERGPARIEITPRAISELILL